MSLTTLIRLSLLDSTVGYHAIDQQSYQPQITQGKIEWE